ncbi:MAG TPA: hypothetical protein VHP11_01600 [Tepidisphaeraceae bacterium]|nr:hypothetical protein [Tepidisphaeraceae bacterium]
MAVVTTPTGQAASESLSHIPRRNPRHVLVAAATVWTSKLPDGSGGIRVSVANVSLDGIAFRSRTAFERDSVCYIRMVAGPLRLEGPIRIGWCRKHDAHSFDSGAMFLNPK